MKIQSLDKIGDKIFLINGEIYNFNFFTKIGMSMRVEGKNTIHFLHIGFFEKTVCTFTANQFQKFQEYYDLNEVLGITPGTIESMFLKVTVI